jgi:hypothetical protein
MCNPTVDQGTRMRDVECFWHMGDEGSILLDLAWCGHGCRTGQMGWMALLFLSPGLGQVVFSAEPPLPTITTVIQLKDEEWFRG